MKDETRLTTARGAVTRESGISFGSNLGDRVANVEKAIAAIAGIPGTSLVANSPMFETEPVDVPDEFSAFSYVNAVAVFETCLDVEEWSRACHAVEDALGRVRTGYHHPRTIDIDILYFGEETRDEPHLHLPHPQIASRRFVCEPLALLRPELRLPGLGGKSVAELLAAIPDRPAVIPVQRTIS